MRNDLAVSRRDEYLWTVLAHHATRTSRRQGRRSRPANRLWPRHPHNADSTQIDPKNQFTFWHGEQMGHGPSNHMDLIPLHGAGVAFGISGVYLFRDLTPVHIDNGEWGLLRVQ